MHTLFALLKMYTYEKRMLILFVARTSSVLYIMSKVFMLIRGVLRVKHWNTYMHVDIGFAQVFNLVYTQRNM